MKSSKKYYEKFVIKRKLEYYEKLFIAFEGIFFIILSFYAGFEFCRSSKLVWFMLFIAILIIKFKWKEVKETTMKMVIGK